MWLSGRNTPTVPSAMRYAVNASTTVWPPRTAAAVGLSAGIVSRSATVSPCQVRRLPVRMKKA